MTGNASVPREWTLQGAPDDRRPMRALSARGCLPCIEIPGPVLVTLILPLRVMSPQPALNKPLNYLSQGAVAVGGERHLLPGCG
jgi:hypothetical protein